MTEEVNNLLADPITTKLKLQSMEVECDKLSPIAEKDLVMSTYVEALDKHNGEVRKMLAGITKVVQGSDTNPRKMPLLIGALRKIYARHEQLMGFAVVNNLTNTKKRHQKK